MNILLVEDDKYFRQSMAAKLKRYGRIDEASNVKLAEQLLSRRAYDVALIDLNLSDSDKADGLKVLELAASKGVVSAVLTSMDDGDLINKAYENRAVHYFHKPKFNKDIHTYFKTLLLAAQRDEFQKTFKSEYITQDESILKGLEGILQSFVAGQAIFFKGPTGAGKSMLAKLIHKWVGGTDKNFVYVNMAEITGELIDSRLFGHKKGAFTDAKDDHEGFFKKANGGTLFLDEIGTTSLDTQKKLLKVLQEKEFIPVGSTDPIKSNCRIITASADNLADLVEDNLFREDFYFRIRGSEFSLPALKERSDDIPLLIEHFIDKSARKIHFRPDAIDALKKYDWFGNVRELENLVKKFINGSLGVIHKFDLPENILNNESPLKSKKNAKLYSRNLVKYVEKNGIAGLLEKIEEDAFKDAMIKNNGRITKAMKALQISSYAAYKLRDRLEQRGEALWK